MFLCPNLSTTLAFYRDKEYVYVPTVNNILLIAEELF